MGKVFTITEGLENLGALKTGGQGSVYKGKRVGEIITAVKLLPTPIYSESPEDKNFLDFQNEVQKLKKVNELPNPNVVKILNSGITDTGNFPFIEMEFIEGPDLQELLQPPKDPVFTIKEAIKVAEHLSNALAHCHQVEVKHGDIKSNNVKYNVHTGNYVLLDFGLAIMSDEQRRTSLRHAGAIEFMAPEQNEGRMLFQTDIYSFGVVLYELLAGQVPFPLEDKGETARNTIMVAHMEVEPPPILELRKKNIPAAWPNAKKEHEVFIPEWLASMVYKCLEKRPEDRFSDGRELYEYIMLNSILTARNEESSADITMSLQSEVDRLLLEKEQLQNNLLNQRQELDSKDREVRELKTRLLEAGRTRTAGNVQSVQAVQSHKKSKGVSPAAFYSLLVATIVLAALAAYALVSNKENTRGPAQVASTTRDTTLNNSGQNEAQRSVREKAAPTENREEAVSNTEADDNSVKTDERMQTPATDTSAVTNDNEPSITDAAEKKLGTYKVKSKAFFHNEPDESTRRNAFVVHWNNATLTALDETNDFIYVVFTNHLGQTSKGWLRKQDLNKAE